MINDINTETNIVIPRYISNRIIEGNWQLSTDPTTYLMFYSFTWRFVSNGNLMDMGIFLLEDEYITLKFEKEEDIRIKYVIENNSIIFSEHTQEWMNNSWNKIENNNQSIKHPLIGTWRGDLDNGRILIFQYTDYNQETNIGIGIHYSFERSITDMDIRISIATFSDNIIMSQPINSIRLQDGVDEQRMIFSRNENDEVEMKLQIIDNYEIIGNELLLKNRFDLICRKI